MEDALWRIQEKYGSIPDDLAKDLRSVEAYIRKHEQLGNGLVALEAQVGLHISYGTEWTVILIMI